WGTTSSAILPELGSAVAAGLLALTGALASACFVKVFGVAFLALPRSPAEAAEAPAALRLGMLPLALACVGLGLAPGSVVGLLGTVTVPLVKGAPTVA